MTVLENLRLAQLDVANQTNHQLAPNVRSKTGQTLLETRVDCYNMACARRSKHNDATRLGESSTLMANDVTPTKTRTIDGVEQTRK